MLQFIVLGQVPGTHFQLTYGWFQLILWPTLVFVAYKTYRIYLRLQSKEVQRHFDVISLRNLDQA